MMIFLNNGATYASGQFERERFSATFFGNLESSKTVFWEMSHKGMKSVVFIK
jgi:hypothetical protein